MSNSAWSLDCLSEGCQYWCLTVPGVLTVSVRVVKYWCLTVPGVLTVSVRVVKY